MDFKKKVRTILSNRRLNLIQQLSEIKQTVDPSDYKEALKLHPNFNRFLNKSPYFKTIDDIYIKDAFQFTRNFKKEYKWLSNIIENHLEQINIFIQHKKKFEYYFILHHFDKARIVLAEIELEFGVSLWSIEANLSLEEFVKGSEANWNKLSIYLQGINNSIYEFIINSSSKRIESKLSYDSYVNQFQNDIDNISAETLLKDFFVFKNFPFASYNYEFENLEGILYVANIFSVVDQYLIFVDVIIYNMSVTNDFDNYFIPFIKKAKELVSDDFKILNIYNLLNKKNDLKDFNINEEVFNCLNKYYSGNFNVSLSLAKNGLEKYPTEYEFYEIYCKSIINLKLNFVPLNISSTIDSLLVDTYNVLTFYKEKDVSYKKLFKTSLVLMNFNLGRQSYGLLCEIEGDTGIHFRVGILSSSFNSYKNLFFAVERISVFKNFISLLHNHCYRVYKFKLGFDIQEETELSESVLQKTIFSVINNFKNRKFEKVVELLNSAKDLDTISYYFERKISLLFYSYLQLNLLKEALLLYGFVFFDERMITRKLSEYELYKRIKLANENEELKKEIDYPMLFSLIVKEYDLYEVFDDFLTSMNIYSIREINIQTLLKYFPLQKIIYFLYNVVTIDTLKYSTDYGSISEVEEDRIYLLNILSELEPINKFIYEKEINEIYRMDSVRKVLKEVDEGRLFIDVNNLKEMQKRKFTDDFNRFKEIQVSSHSQKLIGFNVANTKDWEKALTEKNESLDQYNTAEYLAFKAIYLESRDNFLFSKEYGLDSCLSTRIRHGALKNHIRSVFEKLNLITSKFNDKYKDNETWARQLTSYHEDHNEVQIILKQFSKSIDDYTLYVVEKLIQIQTEKIIGKSEGLFTFFTNDEILFKFYHLNKELFDSIESTIDIILTSLTNRTLVDLQIQIVEHISEAVLKKYQEIIEHSITELRNLNLPYDYQLIPALIKSNTDIQNELESISNWFYLNTTSSTTLLSIETVVDASIELTNKINPNYKIRPSINLNCEPFGVYSCLVFVFNILFNNIIQHSNLNFDTLYININLEIIDEAFIGVTITNNFNIEFDIEEHLTKLKIIKDNWNDHSKIERSNKEGESGFDKIKRILLYESFSKTDKFEYKREDDKISIQLFFPYTRYQKDA